MTPRSECSTLFPYTTLFRSIVGHLEARRGVEEVDDEVLFPVGVDEAEPHRQSQLRRLEREAQRREHHRAVAVALHLLDVDRSEEHTSELQSRQYLVCRLLLE